MTNDKEVIDKILKISDHLSKVLNEHHLRKFGEMHNIDPEFNILELKQEVIGKRCLFPGPKKKYGFYITNREGVDVDEMEIKGLVTQRSDYTQMSKDKLLILLDMICKSDEISWKGVKKFIDDTRNEFITLCRERKSNLGGPVSYSSHMKDYKKIPSHVIGMEFWNKAMYKHFGKGVKGYKIKIIGIDPDTAPAEMQRIYSEMGKPTFIGIPFEEEIVPEFFIIDEEYTINFNWNDRVHELLECVFDKIEGRRNLQNNIVQF